MRPSQVLLSAALAAACATATTIGCKPAAEAPAPEPAKTAAPVEKKALLPQLRGTWSVVLTGKQEKDLRTMAMVFDAAEPTAEDLATLAPEERAAILSMREARKAAPADDPRYQQMRAVLEGMGRSTLVVDTSSLTITVGQVRQAANFVVLTETATSVRLSASTPTGRQEEVELALDAQGALRMSKPNQPDALTFRRALP